MMCSALAVRPGLLTVLPLQMVHITVPTLMMLELDVRLSVSDELCINNKWSAIYEVQLVYE